MCVNIFIFPFSGILCWIPDFVGKHYTNDCDAAGENWLYTSRPIRLHKKAVLLRKNTVLSAPICCFLAEIQCVSYFSIRRCNEMPFCYKGQFWVFPIKNRENRFSHAVAKNRSTIDCFFHASLYKHISKGDRWLLYEPHREKTGFLPMRKQKRRSASR